METLLVAAVAVLVGLAVALFGTRLFAVPAPLWGFLAGLSLGADLVASLGGVGVFSTLAGWLAGAGLGIVLAAVAAVWFTTGTLLLLGRVALADLHGVGPAGAMRGDVPSIATAFVLGTLAFGYQARDLRARRIDTLERARHRF